MTGRKEVRNKIIIYIFFYLIFFIYRKLREEERKIHVAKEEEIYRLF